MAKIKRAGKQHHLGYFAEEAEAAKAVAAARAAHAEGRLEACIKELREKSKVCGTNDGTLGVIDRTRTLQSLRRGNARESRSPR